MGNLGFDTLASNSPTAIDDANAMLDEADAVVTGVVTVPVNDSNANSVAAAQLKRAVLINVIDGSPSPTGDIAITLAALSRGAIGFVNGTAQRVFVSISGQSLPAAEIAAGEPGILVSDDANVVDGMSAGYHRICGDCVGVPADGASPDGSGILASDLLAEDMVLQADFLGSISKASVAATADADCPVTADGVSIGTMTFAAGQDVATFSASAGTIAATSLIEVAAPSPPDATLSGIRFTLLLQRTS